MHIDPRKYWKELREGKVTGGPDFKRGHVVGLADPDRLTIVPDWERVLALTRDSAGARKDWSWMTLPIRWGYPATKSPFAGILPHTDTGNLPPASPTYNGGWNATGPARGFHGYEPHALPAVFPLGFQSSFRNDLGFFNFTVPVLVNLPPLDFLTRVVLYPFKRVLGRRDPVFYAKDSVPFRFVGVSSGVSVTIFDDDYDALALSPVHFDQFVGNLVGHLVTNGADSTTAVLSASDFMDPSVAPFLQVAFYIGGHFASENTVRNMKTTFGLNIDFNNVPNYNYSGEINYWEYTGSLRYNLTTSRLQPFVKGGYGWSWYRVENVQAVGVPFDPPDTDWVGPDNIWPNTWHLGAGVEYIPWKRVGKFPGGIDLALRVEYDLSIENLGLDLSSVGLDRLVFVFPTLGDVPISDRVYRNTFTFGATVSF